MKEEIWKDVVGYESLYEVSNFGQVRSLDRLIVDIYGRRFNFKGRLRKATTVKFGYKICGLSSNSNNARFYIHRLVAIAFIPNPNNYPFINHKDEDPSNNHVSNLEWCTASYNNNYGNHNKSISASRKNNNDVCRSVLQVDNKGNIIKEHLCARDTKIDGFNESTVSQCCRFVKDKLSHKGFIWVFSNEKHNIPKAVERLENKKSFTDKRPINSYSSDGEFIRRFDTLSDAAKYHNTNTGCVCNSCKDRYKLKSGLFFRYAKE